MKLLVLTSNPERASFRQRLGVYVDVLAESGISCEVTVLGGTLLQRSRQFARAREYDGVFIHKKCFNPIDARLLRRYAGKIIFNYDDAIMYKADRPMRPNLTRRLAFRRTAMLADMLLVGSEYLADQGRPHNNRIVVLPLGLEVLKYARKKEMDDGLVRLVWIGSASTVKYLQVILPAIIEVRRRVGNIVLRIVGDTFPDCGSVPVEERIWCQHRRFSDLAECDIGLAPLPDDPFTQGKCSFKVLEYASSELPVCASPVGTNRTYVVDGRTGFLAKDIEGWVNSLCTLAQNRQMRRAMGSAGRSLAEQFDVAVVGQRLAEVIKRTLQAS